MPLATERIPPLVAIGLNRVPWPTTAVRQLCNAAAKGKGIATKLRERGGANTSSLNGIANMGTWVWGHTRAAEGRQQQQNKSHWTAKNAFLLWEKRSGKRKTLRRLKEDWYYRPTMLLRLFSGAKFIFIFESSIKGQDSPNKQGSNLQPPKLSSPYQGSMLVAVSYKFTNYD